MMKVLKSFLELTLPCLSILDYISISWQWHESLFKNINNGGCGVLLQMSSEDDGSVYSLHFPPISVLMFSENNCNSWTTNNTILYRLLYLCIFPGTPSSFQHYVGIPHLFLTNWSAKTELLVNGNGCFSLIC